MMNHLLRKGILTTAVTMSTLTLMAQNSLNSIWEKKFDAKSDSGFNVIAPATDGGYIIGLMSNADAGMDKTQPAVGSYDYWVIKVDQNGNKQWDKTFGGTALDYISSILPLKDGGFILAGNSISDKSADKTQPNQGLADYWVVKIDASGNKIWDRTFGGPDDEMLNMAIETSDGIILGGTSPSNTGGNKEAITKGDKDLWVIKIDNNGNKIWEKSYGSNQAELFGWMDKTADGGFILGGFSNSGAGGDKTDAVIGNGDIWIVKIDANGQKLWDKTIGGPEKDELTRITQTTDGGFIIGGQTNDIKKNKYAFQIIKLDSKGNKIWDKKQEGNGIGYFRNIYLSKNNEIIVTGNSSQLGKGKNAQHSSNFRIIKLEKNGVKTGEKVIEGTDNNYTHTMIQTPDENYLLGSSIKEVDKSKSGEINYFNRIKISKINSNNLGL